MEYELNEIYKSNLWIGILDNMYENCIIKFVYIFVNFIVCRFIWFDEFLL